MSKEETYGIDINLEGDAISAPDLPYKPCNPKEYAPKIGLIACGSVTEHHLRAYKKAGFNIVALCDVDLAKAEKRRAEFYPDAMTTTDFREILNRDDIEVLDIATHPAVRAEITHEALLAGKHVLSQKPFALDLKVAADLVQVAEDRKLKLAVNQNGRWAPHFSYMRQAINAGIIGEVVSADFCCQWDHNWISGTAFDCVKHVLLYDFAVHWFDMASVFFGASRAERVTAAIHKSPTQRALPALLGHVMVEFETGQSTMTFNGDCRFGPMDTTHVVGGNGSLRSHGPGIMEQAVTLYSAEGSSCPALEGSWFPEGLHGTMGELLCAIEEDREPIHCGRNNLRTLELCFAAVASADSGRPETPGAIRTLPV